MMESGSRKQRWINNNRRSQNKKQSHGSWQRSVPSWEKDFCKAVGSLDWETLLQMKKYMQFYDNVINWDDSAGKDAFCNAKKRYWAEINGYSCDIPLPDPDLYIENINWNSEMNPVLIDLDSIPVSPKSDRDPVVIFGDSFAASQGFSPTGWGDVEENFKVPVSNNYSEKYGDPAGQNWDLGDSCNNMAASGWPDCNNNNNNNNNNNVWEYSDGNGQGYMSWGDDWNNNWGWGNNGNNYNYVGPYVEDRGLWDDGNVRTACGDKYVSSYGTWRVQANNGCKNRGDKGRHKGSYRGKQEKRAGYREWNPINSCGPVNRRGAIRVGENWNRDKRVS